MSKSDFDPAAHLIQLPGRGGKGPTDYLPVAARIAWFRAEHPDGQVHLEHIEISDQRAVFKAEVGWVVAEGRVASAMGYGSETPGDFRDYIEKASTKALGRALAALGYGTLQAGDELDEGARIVDAPLTRQDGTGAANTPRARQQPTRTVPDQGSAAGPPPPTPAAPADPPRAPAGAPPAGNGKRAPTFAEALRYALDETISAKGRHRAATIALELSGSLDELADTYSKVMALPERVGLKEAYEARHKELKELEAVPF